jgi:WD40 repeat protein
LKHRLKRFIDHGDRFSNHTNSKHLTASDLSIKLGNCQHGKRIAIQKSHRSIERNKVTVVDA